MLSSRPIAAAPTGAMVERMSGTPTGIVSQLEARGIQHIYVDGGITIQQFLQAGVIQRLIITRVPVLIGTGIPLFGPLRRDISLKHIATRQYASGLVQSEYVVVAAYRIALKLRATRPPAQGHCTTVRARQGTTLRFI